MRTSWKADGTPWVVLRLLFLVVLCGITGELLETPLKAHKAGVGLGERKANMRYWKLKSIEGNPKVGIVVVTYEQTSCLQSLLACYKSQTYKNFIILVSHDGPASQEVKSAYKAVVGDDPRFIFKETEVRSNQFGHERRSSGFKQLIELGADYLGTSNGDCWYTPNFFESLVYEMQKSNTMLAYCDMIHSHKMWQPLRVEMRRGRIDAGSWLGHKDIVGKAEWTDFGFFGDWSFIHKLHKLCEGRHTKVDGFLYVHN